jgi:serine/threonine protein kinase
MAMALAAAHHAGAIHRDIKPSNVMVDRAGNVKLLDFGLAHGAEQAGEEHHEASRGQFLGTLDYMSPEQADGGPVTCATDLYGLGATLFFLLTGRPPRTIDRQQPLYQQLKLLANEAAPSLSEVRADVPSELSDLVAQLLTGSAAE